VSVLLAAPALAPAANQDIVNLRRDVALLQQKIDDMQRAQDQKLAQVLEVAQKALDAASRANASVSGIASNIDKSLAPLQQSLVAPLAAANSRLNDTGNDIRTLQQNVTDLAATVNRMQQQMDDIKRLLQTIQAPPPAPATQPGAAPSVPGGPGGSVPQASDTKPTMSAGDLYNSALSDMRGGKYDLAVSGFTDYLRWYPTEQFAPNSQYYIGIIHFQAKNYEQAVKDFDMVLEHYVYNPKTEEAMLYKGKALAQLAGHKTEAVNEFRQLIKEYPKSDPARLACEELTGLGMNCPTTPATASRTAGKRTKK
jgi:tol-pal system protein YbgF